MKLFWTILKYFGMVSGTLVTLYGAFTLLDDIRDNIQEVQDTVEYINIEQSWMAEDLEHIKDSLVVQRKDMETLIWGLKNKDKFDATQFEDIFNQFLKKNLSSQILNSSEIPLVGTYEESENEIESMIYNSLQ